MRGSYFVNPDSLGYRKSLLLVPTANTVGTAQQIWVILPMRNLFLHISCYLFRFFEDLIEYVAWDVELYIWSEHYICQWLIVERLLGAEKGRIANCVKIYYRRKYTHYTGVGRGNFVQQLTSFVAFPLTKPAITHDSARYQMDYMDLIFPLIPLSFL